MAFTCPHCNSLMATRTSEMTSPLSKQTYYQCVNLHCGHVAIGVTELIRSIVPSNFPNPHCHLPVKKPEDPRDPARKASNQQELNL